MARRRTYAVVSALIGTVVLLAIPLWSLWVFPYASADSAKEMDLVVVMEGDLSLLNADTAAMDESEISVVRTVSSSESGDSVEVFESTRVSDAGTGELLPAMFQLDASFEVDPVGRRLDGGVQWSFPIDTQPRDYAMLDGELTSEAERGAIPGDTVVLAYSGEEERNGVDTYKFIQETRILAPDVDPAFGAPAGSDEEIAIATTYWVEPASGVIVDMERTSERYVTFPDLARIPVDLRLAVTLRGTAGILNTTRLLGADPFDSMNITVEKLVQSQDSAGGILLVSSDTSVYDSDAGVRLPDAYQYPSAVDGVDPATADIVAGHGNAARAGLFSFPMGTEKVNYTLWSYETSRPVLAVYDGEEAIDGVTVYRYTVSADNATLGTMEQEGVEFERAQTTRMTYWVEPATGMVVDVAGDMLQYGRFPDLARIPADLNLSYDISGWARMLDQANLDPDDPYDEFSMTLRKSVRVVGSDGGVLEVESSTTGQRDDRGELPAEFAEPAHTMLVDAATAQILDGAGRLSFPVGVNDGVYWLWSAEAKRVLPARYLYLREETLMGIPVRVYRIQAETLFVEERAIPMSDKTLSLYYNGTTDYYVEPATGYVLDVRSDGEHEAWFPVIAEIPPEMSYDFWFEGSLWSSLTGFQHINMTKTVRGVDTIVDGAAKVRVIYDNNTMRNDTTKEIISLGSVGEKCAIDSATGTHLLGYGSDADREGHFYFPQLSERKDYEVWNSEMQIVDLARYDKDVVVDGLECFVYRVEYYDRSVGIGQTYDNRVVYTVEPVSGMIVDTVLDSSQKISGFPITELHLRYTDECRADKTAEAKWLKGVVTMFNGQHVPAATFSYSFTPAQVAENAREAEKMRSQITLSGETVCVARIHLRMDPDCSERMLEAARTNSTLLNALSGKRVLAMRMTIAFTPETSDRMSELALDARRQLLLGEWGLPMGLALLGGVLVMVPVAAYQGGAKDE